MVISYIHGYVKYPWLCEITIYDLSIFQVARRSIIHYDQVYSHYDQLWDVWVGWWVGKLQDLRKVLKTEHGNSNIHETVSKHQSDS